MFAQGLTVYKGRRFMKQITRQHMRRIGFSLLTFGSEGEETLKYKIPAVLVLVVLSVALALAQTPMNTSLAPAGVVSGSFSFTTIDFPGANQTRALGLNDNGDIVGTYRDSSGVFLGYLLSQGNFTTVDVPGSIQTRVLAINNLGVIGGHFLDSSRVRHSFLLNHGAFTIFDFPGATATILQGMNDRDQVVGGYVDSSGTPTVF